MTVETAPQPGAASPSPNGGKKTRVKLGEELPIFCERCGYSLYGLPQGRCERCSILHFVCPECNHHQPINTIRPAFQRILGRMRAFVLLIVVLVKLNFYFWTLFGWGAFGYEWSFEYHYRQVTRTAPGGGTYTTYQQSTVGPRRLEQVFEDEEVLIGLSLLGLGFGIVGRMFLLRWRNGFLVGAAMGALVVLSFVVGALFRQYERDVAASPFIWDFWIIATVSAALVIAGSTISWPLWSGFVRLVMPRETALAFLEWQRGSAGTVSGLARA